MAQIVPPSHPITPHTAIRQCLQAFSRRPAAATSGRLLDAAVQNALLQRDVQI
jgi:hypothetical protein